MGTPTPDELRAAADRIEAEALKAERLKTADKIPTCAECGGRYFTIGAWTTVDQGIDFEDAEDATEGAWGDDYKGGDHGQTNAYATCDGCGADVAPMLQGFGWTFYDDPQPKAL